MLQVAHAASSPSRRGISYDDLVRPRDADPGHMPRLASSGEVVHFQNADVRLDPDVVLFGDGEEARVAAWLRPLDGEMINPAWLVAMRDILPPAVFSRTSRPVKAATIEYIVHLATGEPSVPQDEYVYLACRSPLSTEGFAVADADAGTRPHSPRTRSSDAACWHMSRRVRSAQRRLRDHNPIGWQVTPQIKGGSFFAQSRYSGHVAAARPIMTGDEWAAADIDRPPTPDDVTITLDGRRIDSKKRRSPGWPR